MDEQATPDRDAIPPQPRTVGRASVPGPSSTPADAPPVSRAATTYTAARDVADDDAVDSAPRIPLPRASERGADFGLPAAIRGVSEPLPRRRARSIQEFTDGPDPSSGGTPWSPFGADEKPPPPQDPNPYRVRATARVPGSLPPMEPQRADRILPDGPLIDELFFDGPPVNRLDEAPPALVSPPGPPSAADYAAALMQEWKSETADRGADHDLTPDADRMPAAHDPWAESGLVGGEPLAVNSGRARNVTIRSFPEDPDADDEPQASSEIEQAAPDLSEPAQDEPEPSLSGPIPGDPGRDEPDLSRPGLSRPDLGVTGRQLAEPAQEDSKRLLGLFGDSFDDLSFDRTPFDHAIGSDAAPRQAAPEQAVKPDLAALYGAPTDGAADPAHAVDAYWGSPEPLAPLPRREPQPIESLPFESESFESQRLDAGRFDSGSVGVRAIESRSGESAPVEPQAVEVRPDAASPAASPSGIEPASAAEASFAGQSFSAVAGSQPDVATPEEPPVAPVIGTIRAAVRVPGLMIERPPDDDEDRPLAVPQALAVPPVLERSEPAPDGAIVRYSAEDWRGNVRGSAAVSSESAGTVYVSDVDDDDEDEPLSLTQKLLRSGVIVLLVLLFVAAFRYGPNIDEWLHS